MHIVYTAKLAKLSSFLTSSLSLNFVNFLEKKIHSMRSLYFMLNNNLYLQFSCSFSLTNQLTFVMDEHFLSLALVAFDRLKQMQKHTFYN